MFLSKLFSSKDGTSVDPKYPIYDIAVNGINGEPISLAEYQGKYLLFVNVASKCGFTPQYEKLEKLYQDHKDRLVIIGTPCNQFGGQEPGTEQEIQSFCKLNYGVTFPITAKMDVKGGDQHELYKWLTNKEINGKKDITIRWNFGKILVDQSGKLIDSYGSMTSPTSDKITKHLK